MNASVKRGTRVAHHRGLVARVCAVVGSLGLGACIAPVPVQPMRIAPSYHVDHAGPGLAQGYAALARQYEGERRFREARDAWRKAAREAPRDADILNGLGQAEAAQGDFAAAVAALERAVALAPGRAPLRNNLGYALLLAGRDEESRSVLRQALALQPGHVLAQTNLGLLDDRSARPPPTWAAAAPSASAGAVPMAVPGTHPGALPGAAPARALDAAAVATGAEGAVPARAVSTPPEIAVAPAAIRGSTPGEAPTRLGAVIEIANGNGVNGMAACMADALRTRGVVAAARLRNALPYDTPTTVVRYRAGYALAAETLASHLPGRPATVAGTGSTDNLDLRVVLGQDLRAGVLCTGARAGAERSGAGPEAGRS